MPPLDYYDAADAAISIIFHADISMPLIMIAADAARGHYAALISFHFRLIAVTLAPRYFALLLLLFTLRLC